MSASRRTEVVWLHSLLPILGCVWLAAGCQSIAGVEDVTVGDVASPQACSAYCDLVIEHCPGDTSVYDDRDTCMAVCAAFRPGSPDRPSGNTLACRFQEARQAAAIRDIAEKRAHCPAAGPGGGDRCVDNTTLPGCDGYCSVYMRVCADISADWGFGSPEECAGKCGAVPPGAAYAAPSAATSGDTLGCRLYHASAAALDPETHCAAAGLIPADACVGRPPQVPSCRNFCKSVEIACAGDMAVYESRTQCEKVCEQLRLGSTTDTGGEDTVGCRTYHTYNALVVSDTAHCPHTGPGGDGVCSEPTDANCKPYCLLAASACEVGFLTSYGTEERCLEECRLLEDAEPHNNYTVQRAQSGDTLKCRTLHAARALEKPAESLTHCAAVFGGNPCD